MHKVHAEVVKALNTPKIKDTFLALGYSVVGNTPEAFARHIETDRKRYVDVARKANIVIK